MHGLYIYLYRVFNKPLHPTTLGLSGLTGICSANLIPVKEHGRLRVNSVLIPSNRMCGGMPKEKFDNAMKKVNSIHQKVSQWLSTAQKLFRPENGLNGLCSNPGKGGSGGSAYI